ncbi:betaine-aldehyde dehydrogenase [Marinococcus halophilus]|uniref:Putative aldehyde dehydrogenase DhaS n=1 Tax=Marinococcus halophilus TaxID=1371 RepID=A0A510Y959_MARHA|nr:aldehyde dehydrogenase family protein [Marinococcus halophilus]OZT79088.1 betaine-aldehyde dehydrogenase [Marinococcus halophilus]GEK59928.1 putative aldehyde dehydrogenase DhaS [Marinococcus halophilus]
MEIDVLPEVKDFLKQEQLLFIDGEFQKSVNGSMLPVVNPATEQELCDVHAAEQEDVDAAVKAARRSFESEEWASMDARVRAKLMNNLADLLERDIDILAQLDTLNNGKPLSEMYGSDLPNAIEQFRYYAGWTTKWTGQTIPIAGEFFNYTRHEPVGVAGQIIPWNFPLMMACWKIAPAIAVGCTVVLKPAEQTPLSALYLAKLVQEAGFPKGVINIIPGLGKTAGQALIEHEDVDKIAFTGSSKTGQHIMKMAADTFKRLTLELGGKSPNIIMPDADLDKAIPGVFYGIMANKGEICCAGSRVFVPENQYEDIVDKMVEFAETVNIGSGLDEENVIGPLISKQQFNQVASYIEEGMAEGAEKACGGVLDREGYYIQPTVFKNVTEEMQIAKEEIFGPVVVVLPYTSEEEVIQKANNTPYGLAAGIWTENIRSAHKIAHRLKAGTVWVNSYNLTDPATPFGGFKASGFGREMGSYALNNYTEVKSVWINLEE